MSIDRLVMMFAGSVMLLSLLLAHFVSRLWLWLAAFVGACVYVIDSQGLASLRYVRPGHRFGDNVEILAGLAAGERIALDPIAAAAQVVAAGPKP